MEGTSKTKEGYPKEGELTYYYENGNKKSVSNYTKGRAYGKDFGWYENGNKKLIDFLNKSLDFLTNENNVGPLVKIAVFHYLFGYAHPFYNGNGRTSRFISSYLLCNILNQSIALRISYTIKNDKLK